MKRINLHLFLGPLLAVILFLVVDLQPGKPQVTAMAAIVVWMAWWWMTEPVHLGVTSLLPLILMPLMGIAGVKSVAQGYIDDIIFLFIGGFLVAFAVQYWQLHRRIALRILLAVGTQPTNMLFGVMLTAYLISMWVSNTATVMMLLPAIFALLLQVEEFIGNEAYHKRITTGLLVGLAYAASIGGMATLVGTPTNMIFFSRYQQEFPQATDINFLTWMAWGLPVSLLLLFTAFLILRWLFIPRDLTLEIGKTYFKDVLRDLGPMRYEEKIVTGLFLLLVVLWFTRSDIQLGTLHLTGWSSGLGYKKDWMQDAWPALLIAVLLFLWPSKSEPGRKLLMWSDAEKLPLDVILLFGSGFALSLGFRESGLNDWMQLQLSGLEGWPLPLVIGLICLIVTIISEFASNVACIQLMLPILLVLYQPLNVPPALLLVPATLASSLGFMLPVATAPNTIVFSSRKIRVKDMYRAGFWIDSAGIVIITLAGIIAAQIME